MAFRFTTSPRFVEKSVRRKSGKRVISIAIPVTVGWKSLDKWNIPDWPFSPWPFRGAVALRLALFWEKSRSFEDIETPDSRKCVMPSRSDRSLVPPDLAPGEENFLEGWRKHIHKKYPNPERKGCPDRSALELLASDVKAFRSLPNPDEILLHLGRCAPCGDEFRELRLGTVSQRSGKRRLMFWLVGSLALAGLGTFLAWKHLKK